MLCSVTLRDALFSNYLTSLNNLNETEASVAYSMTVYYEGIFIVLLINNMGDIYLNINILD